MIGCVGIYYIMRIFFCSTGVFEPDTRLKKTPVKEKHEIDLRPNILYGIVYYSNMGVIPVTYQED